MRSYIRPVVEVLNLWPRWRFAHRGPIVVPASRARAAIGLMRCRIDRWAICRVARSASPRGKSSAIHSPVDDEYVTANLSCESPSSDDHAASGKAGLGSNATSRDQTAQTIRPSLFATAIVALL